MGSYGEWLCLCDWQMSAHRARVAERLRSLIGAEFENGETSVLANAAAQLDDYFAGKRTSFDVPRLFVGTEFQKTVWSGLLTIPYGMTVSYGEMAERIGCPRSVRGVANATGANALSIFVPCHRVVGADGSLTGYAGGLDAKQYLLRLESGGAK